MVFIDKYQKKSTQKIIFKWVKKHQYLIKYETNRTETFTALVYQLFKYVEQKNTEKAINRKIEQSKNFEKITLLRVIFEN